MSEAPVRLKMAEKMKPALPGDLRRRNSHVGKQRPPLSCFSTPKQRVFTETIHLQFTKLGGVSSIGSVHTPHPPTS